MWTYEVVIISAITIIIFIIGAYLFGGPQEQTQDGGKALKKLTTAALNMDLIKSGYKTYKKIKK
jgi:hypothetical protein